MTTRTWRNSRFQRCQRRTAPTTAPKPRRWRRWRQSWLGFRNPWPWRRAWRRTRSASATCGAARSCRASKRCSPKWSSSTSIADNASSPPSNSPTSSPTASQLALDFFGDSEPHSWRPGRSVRSTPVAAGDNRTVQRILDLARRIPVGTGGESPVRAAGAAGAATSEPHRFPDGPTLERRLTDPGSHVHVPNGMHRPSTPTEEDRLLLSTTFLGTVRAVDGDRYRRTWRRRGTRASSTRCCRRGAPGQTTTPPPAPLR